MQASKTGIDSVHPALKAYAARYRIDSKSFRRDGRLAVTIDDKYRVQLTPAGDGRLALTSLLLDISMVPVERVEATLVRLLNWAAGTLRDHAAALALEEATEQLVLQQLLPASADLAQLEAELAAFVNVLAFWSPISMLEASSPPGA